MNSILTALPRRLPASTLLQEALRCGVRAICAVGWLHLISSLALGQVQRVKLIPPDVEYEDNFGHAVAIDGDWVLISSPLDDDIAAQSGAVYVYRRESGVWNLSQKLKASDTAPSAQFGYSLAMDGAYAVIGALLDAPMGIQGAGSAYVFERIADVWVQRVKVWASDASPSWNFGEAVDISGGVVVVGSRAASGVSAFSGLAYVFEGAGSSWWQTARLVPSDAAQGDSFGDSVAVDGTRLVVGAPGADLPTGGNQGVAYVFDRPSAGAWVEVQKLSAPGTLNEYFGSDVDLQGETMVVGATSANAVGPVSGAAHYFRYLAGRWEYSQLLVGFDTKAYDKFGSWVALDGDVAIASSHLTDDLATNSGGGYAFNLQGSTWQQDGKLLPEDSYASHLVGMEVALSGRTVILGCRFDNSACPQDPACHSGAAYIFDLPTNATQYGSCASAAPCGNTDTHGGCRNKTGHGSTLQACGNTSFSADDLFLQMRELPPNSSHRLYMGPLQMSALFGNGQRLVAPGSLGYYRYPILQANAQGFSSFGPGIIAHSQGFGGLGQILPGQTWRFQGWHRDIGGPCGNFFNLTNGLSVTFAP